MKKMSSRKRTFSVALLTTVLMTGLGVASSVQAQTANAQEKIQLMASAIDARNEGDFATAKAKLEQLIKLAPNDRAVQGMLADVNKSMEGASADASAAPEAAKSKSPVPVRAYVEQPTSPEKPVAVKPLTNEKVNADVRKEAKAYNDEVVAAEKAAAAKAREEMRDTKLAAAKAQRAADKTARAGEYAAAREDIQAALEALPEGKDYDAQRKSLKRQYADIVYDQAYAAYDAMEYASAKGFLKEYEDYQGGADSRSNYLNKLIAIYSANARTQNIETISPGFADKQKQINEMLVKARAQYVQGDYQGALGTYHDIELRDPDNSEAKAYQVIILRELNNSAVLDHSKTRAEMLDAVNRAWQRPQIYQGEKVIVDTDVAQGAELRKRLEAMVLPRVSFTDMPLNKVVETLSELSTEYDSAGKGINMLFIPPAAGAPAPAVSITLRGLTLSKILELITKQVGYQYDVTDDAVVVKPDVGGTIDSETRFFPISRAVVIRLTGFSGSASSGGGAAANPWASGNSAPAASGPSPAEEESKLKEFFQRAGVPFEGVPGASMAFDGTRIIATNTPRNLERLDNILKRYTDLKQVEIEAKFLDVQEGVLQELGFNWRVSNGLTGNYFQTSDGSNSNLRKLSKSVVGTNAGRQSTMIISENAYEDLAGNVYITTSSTSIPQTIPSIPGSLNLGADSVPTFSASVGVINGYSIDLMIQALDQRQGVDLMSAPKVTVLSGKRAEIVVAQQLRYPTSFGDVQSEVGQGGSINGGGSAGVTITAGTPQDFEVENVGVTMEVTPTVEEDDSISLALEPKVTEFEGFVEYGGASVAISSGTTVTVPSGFIQPIFSTRMIRTEVTIFDGATVVMGGLTREDTRTVNDRVPILGDIPLVGRLFQSKGESTNKRNLLIFVTANLISPGGAPARQNLNKMPAGSLFQNPTVVTPATSARRTVDDGVSAAKKK